jgi:hypothetical protein
MEWKIVELQLKAPLKQFNVIFYDHIIKRERSNGDNNGKTEEALHGTKLFMLLC